MERDFPRMRFAVGGEHLKTTACRGRNGFANQPRLTNARRPRHGDHRSDPIDRLVQDRRDRYGLRLAAHEARMPTTHPVFSRRGQQPTRRHRGRGTLNKDEFLCAQGKIVLNEAGGSLAGYPPPRRRDRLHPLSHPDLLTNGGVTESARTDLTSNHLARVQPDPQLEIDTVAAFNFDGKWPRILLDCQRCETGTDSVVLQGHGCAEHRHDPVAGETADRAPETLYHPGTPVGQFGHDLP